MRAVIVWFDGLLRRLSGVFQFTDDPRCIFRLQLTNTRHDVRLSDGTVVRKGDPVLGLHFWNEHLPPIGPEGSDVAWGARAARMTHSSLGAIASWLQDHPELADRQVIGGTTVLIESCLTGGTARLIRRLGFDIFPFESVLGRFGEFWENLYTWGLMWAYNRASLRRKRLLRLRRTEIWMRVDKLVARFGRGDGGPIGPPARKGMRDEEPVA
jgi:hypothetical protein